MFHDLERQKKKNETKTTPLSSLSSAFLRPSLFCFLFFFLVSLSRRLPPIPREKMAEKSEIFFYLNDQNKKKQTPTRFQPRFQVWPAPNEDWKFNGNSIKAKTAPLDLDRIDFKCSNNDDRQWNALPDSHWNSSSTKKLISLIQRSKRHIWCETKKNKKKQKKNNGNSKTEFNWLNSFRVENPIRVESKRRPLDQNASGSGRNFYRVFQ